MGPDTGGELAAQLTALLLRWREGEPEAVERLMPLIYPELRRIARRCLRKDRQDPALSPTELVHETYLRLAAAAQPTWESRTHFYSVASRLMRQVLVDFLREQNAQKRGGGRVTLALDTIRGLPEEPGRDVLALHDALTELSAFDARKARILEMRFFGGMTSQEIGEVLGLSAATVNRDLRAANAWLRARLTA